MKLIVGLGNPGQEYEATRHNIGFKAIDAYSHEIGVELNKEKFNGSFHKEGRFILAKPLTYMNNSGDFVSKIIKFYKIDIQDILVVYDDLDMETAKIRFRASGSSGGQKGIEDIMDKLGTKEVNRLKIGIGKPKNGAKNWVLGKFTKLQLESLNQKKAEIIKFIDDFIKGE